MKAQSKEKKRRKSKIHTEEAAELLLTEIKRLVARPLGSEIVPFRELLDDWGVERAELPVTTLPVLAHLEGLSAHANEDTRPLVQTLIDTAGDLHWRQSFTEQDISAEFLSQYGWTDVVGQRGPFVSSKVRAGFVLFAPHMYYPPHAHVAEELYVVLAGNAEWQKGEEPFNPKTPGAVILHTTMMFHAMRSAEEPLLAFYMWRGGDLIQKPTFG